MVKVTVQSAGAKAFRAKRAGSKAAIRNADRTNAARPKADAVEPLGGRAVAPEGQAAAVREARGAGARARRSAERRDAILAASLEEFAACGFAAARLDDVARRAGVAKGTIYLHFEDKEALFQELI